MRRVVLFGAAWIVLLAALAATLGTPGRPAVKEVDAGFRLPPPRAGARYPGWTVTRAYSAHHMMVIEVETERLADASTIAAQVVEPHQDHYDEVLIYFREANQPADDLPAQRIQWTRRGGFVAIDYRRLPRKR